VVMLKCFLFRWHRTIHEISPNVTKYAAFRAVSCDFVDLPT